MIMHVEACLSSPYPFQIMPKYKFHMMSPCNVITYVEGGGEWGGGGGGGGG